MTEALHEQPPPALPSLTRSSLARSLADGVGVVLGLAAGVMAARWLGPDGKGLLASLTVLVLLVGLISTLGLGEAAIVWVGQKRTSLEQACSVTLTATLVASAGGMIVLWLAGAVSFAGDWPAMRVPLLIGVGAVPFYVLLRTISLLLDAQEKVGSGSLVQVTQTGLTALGLALLVGAGSLGLTGGSLAYLLGALGACLIGSALLGGGRLVRPGWNWSYLKPAFRYGIAVEFSNLMIIAFLRGDLLLVYVLAGSAAAGYYSVALTTGALVSILPMALSTATFPRLARLDEGAADRLIAQVCRASTLVAVAGGASLAAVSPLAIPLLFGQDFSSAVMPAAILAFAGMVVSVQWILCYAQAARAGPGCSYGLSRSVCRS